MIRLLHRPGHFLVEGEPLAEVWPPDAAARVAGALGGAHATGPYRTLAQDPSFAVDQLVEIAIRALSPAVNDTFTALACIDWLGRRPRQDRRPAPSCLRASGPRRTREGDHGQRELPPAGRTRPREDPPGQRGHAGGDDPPARFAVEGHGPHSHRRSARAPAGGGRQDPSRLRGDRARAGGSGCGAPALRGRAGRLGASGGAPAGLPDRAGSPDRRSPRPSAARARPGRGRSQCCSRGPNRRGAPGTCSTIGAPRIDRLARNPAADPHPGGGGCPAAADPPA